jgi:hypothetical protein
MPICPIIPSLVVTSLPRRARGQRGSELSIRLLFCASLKLESTL